MFGWIKQQRRNRLRAQPFPDDWLAIIERNVAYYHHLTSQEQAELQDHIQVFLAEKHFEGCGGLTVTDEMRLTIAAQACVLLLHRKDDYYPALKTIFVYPRHFFNSQQRVGPGGIVTEGPTGRLGESWHRGPVVLSWDDAKQSAADHLNGHNVVFHEFAHQLDDEAGHTNGAPRLDHRSQYLPWARVLGAEYAHLIDELKHHHRTDIDPYGATNPAEFFAVVTECFFEKPRQLQRRHPELYEQLKSFYHQDPAQRNSAHASRNGD